MELAESGPTLIDLEKELKLLLLPKDSMDDRNVMIEIRAGAGGDEASIFVGDVLRMYQHYCRDLGYKIEIVSLSGGDEGIKEVICSVSGEKVYSPLKIRIRGSSGTESSKNRIARKGSYVYNYCCGFTRSI